MKENYLNFLIHIRSNKFKDPDDSDRNMLNIVDQMISIVESNDMSALNVVLDEMIDTSIELKFHLVPSEALTDNFRAILSIMDETKIFLRDYKLSKI